ncbi:transposase [Sansalvadorimonas sp. 2012CJ34-2]|uniref:Transposase n=1 Tax=Parendozoicomonas callyspongiae TaxID=2942213 RepID=A0ABT0PDC2_9GAMM|nr:transposase [Sansalvadorimonas sp. 2012CJ34-2]MCL6269256.1 transposase [Sansalvadorimonas sp. 2012CJ34-2]
MTTKKKRNFHSPGFKTEALKLAEKTSIPSAAKELGLQESQLYSWRTVGNSKKAATYFARNQK